ncbi:MAG TPA: FhaA domain-containing protein [Patescibacteria group bacterium]|nr:FhaA domain-containing protein [Patescibacteria group bacterium]
MGPLAAVERFLERLFERQTARLFRTAIRPVQVQRRVERAMEASRVRDGARTVVPHRFLIRIAPDEMAALRSSAPDLAPSLADGALAFARSHGFTLLDRPIVTLRPDPSVPAGDIVVDAADPFEPDAAARGDDADGRNDDGDRDSHARIAGRLDAAGHPVPAGDPSGSLVDEPGAAHETSGSIEHTAVFVVPGAEGPRATIREIRPDRSSRTIEFDGRPITIGRAPDNGLVVRDGRASRHHARIDGRRGSLVLTDLGSTNGSFVNDRQVESIALGEGDRIRIGTTSLIVEAVRLDPRVTTGRPAGGPDAGDEEGD